MGRWIVLIFVVVLADWAASPMAESARAFREVFRQVNPSVAVMETRDQQQSPSEVMVAKNMSCRQCQGKCKAEALRCRSQCAGESACLAYCDEQSNKCEAMCNQIFQCE